MSNSNSEEKPYIEDKRTPANLGENEEFYWINRITTYSNRYIAPSAYIHKSGDNIALRIFKFKKYNIQKGSIITLHSNFIYLLFKLFFSTSEIDTIEQLELPENKIINERFQIAQNLIATIMTELKPLSSLEIILTLIQFEKYSELMQTHKFDITPANTEVEVIEIDMAEPVSNINLLNEVKFEFDLQQEKNAEIKEFEESLKRIYENAAPDTVHLNKEGYLVKMPKNAPVFEFMNSNSSNSDDIVDIVDLLTPPVPVPLIGGGTRRSSAKRSGTRRSTRKSSRKKRSGSSLIPLTHNIANSYPGGGKKTKKINKRK